MRREAIWVVGGLAVITALVFAVAGRFMARELLFITATASLVVGCLGAAFLFFGRRKTTSGVLGGFLGGSALKMASFTALYFIIRARNADPTPPLLSMLTAFFLYYLWTSYRFHVSSQR